MRQPPSYPAKLGGGGWRVWGGPNLGGPVCELLLPHAYFQGRCVSGAGPGKLLVVVVKQGLQMGKCVHSGGGDLHFATNNILFSASSC